MKLRFFLACSLLLGSTSAAIAGDILLPEKFLRPGESISSPNGMYTLILQTDGSLVMYRSNGTIRYSMGKNGTIANLQNDGNFVFYRNSTLLWQSGVLCPCNSGQAWLQIMDNGELAAKWENSSHSMGGAHWSIGADPEPPTGSQPSPGVRRLTPPGTPPTIEPTWPAPATIN